MHRILPRLLVGLACFFVALNHAHAAAFPEITKGLGWLAQQPRGDGTLVSEQLSLGALIQARAESFRLLQQQSTSALPVSAVDALLAISEDNTEFLARKTIVAGVTKRPGAVLAAALAQRQNADGGFGPAAGYQSSAVDTAWALLAWRAVNYSDTGATMRALTFLATHANADGGFGPEGLSVAFHTGYAVMALQVHSIALGTSPAIAPARAWLVNHRTQGSFGNVIDNAVGVLALAATSTDASLFAGAVSALRLSQSADGSWGEDPYATALALSALIAADGTVTPDGAGAISGTLVDADSGAGIAGVQIIASGPQSAAILSGPSGSFLLQGLSAGDYGLAISKQGYTGASAQARVETAATTSLGTIRLRSTASTATLKGQVRDGSTGTLLSGVTIALSTGSTALTDATGSYQITGLAPGNFVVVASKSGYASVTGAGSFAAGSLLVFSPSLYPNGQTPQDVSAHGTVVDAKSRAPIAGATVRIGTQAASTDAAGQFTLSTLTEGATTLQASASNYTTTSFALTLAKGMNELAAIELSAKPASITLTGRITDQATNLPLSGASIVVGGTTLRAASDPAGIYRIAGLDLPQFTLSVSVPGYLRKVINVSLPSFDDTTVDVSLDAVQSPSGISIKHVSTSRPSYAPFSSIEIEVDVANAGNANAELRFAAVILDPSGVPALELPARLTTQIPANQETEVELETFITNQPAGLYALEVHAYDSDGVLQAEGAASFMIDPVRRVSGGITLDPPITQAGTNQPVSMKASLFNQGNLDIAAGPAQLTVTVERPDVSGTQSAQLVVQPLASGSPLRNIAGLVYDAQGIAYALNASDRKIVRVAPDGSTSILLTLPQTLSSPSLSVVPVDLAIDRQGIFYVLNQSSEILKVTPAGAITRIRTNLFAHRGIDVAADGTLYVTDASVGIYALYRVTQAGVVTALANAGLSTPRGVAVGVDGSLYVANLGDDTIAKITPDGRVLPFVSSGLNLPQGIVSDTAGNLYVANSGLANVVKITPAGAVSVFATGFISPYGVAIDAAGNLLVTDRGADAVLRVPPSGGVAQPFARALVSAPQGMRYDSQGNLFIAGSDQVVKLDASDKVTVLSTSLTNASGVAVDASDNVYVVRQGAGQLSKITPAGTVSTVSTGLSSPYGVAADSFGMLYVTESGANRISRIDGSGQRQTYMEALVVGPRHIQVDATGRIFVLNTDSLVQLQGSGQYAFWSRNLSAPQTFVYADDGFIYTQEFNAVRRIDAAGNVTAIKSALPALAAGIAADASGNLYIAEQTSRQLERIDSAGNISVIATLPASPSTFTSDGSGGFYVLMADNRIVRVDASGAVSATIVAIAGATRLAFDPSGSRLLVMTGGGVLAVNPTTKVITNFVSQNSLTAITVAPDGSVLLANASTSEILTYSAAGALQASIAGFNALKDIVWTGSSLIFADNSRIYSLPPNQYPRILASVASNFLEWRGNTLYLTTFSNVSVLTAANLVLPLFSQAGFTGLSGIAVRGDGTLSVASASGSRVQTISAAGQVTASYANILTPKGIAAAADGSVFVTSGNNQILRLDASGKRSSLFATATNVDGLAVNDAGQLFAVSNRQVLRYDAAGNATLLGTSTGLTSLSGIAVQGDSPTVSDPSFSVLRRVKGVDLKAYAAGLTNPRRLKVGPDGAVYVANLDSNVVTRVAAGATEVYAADVTRPMSLAFSATGELFVGGLNGDMFAVNPDRTLTGFVTLGNLLGGGSLDYVAVDSSGIPLFARSLQNDLLKIHVTPPSIPPAAGTVLFSAAGAMPALPVGGTAMIDFGSWVPPFGGDFKFSLSTGTADGQVVNTLHVGPGASGQLSASRTTLPPGDSLLRVTATLKGADFTTIAKADVASLSLAAPNVGTATKAMGADAAGNIYYTSNTQLIRVTPQGQSSVIYTAPASIAMRGAIPVDDQQNVYVTGLATQIIRVAPDGTSSAIASLPSNIVSLMRDSRDDIIALTSFSMYRIKRDGAVFEIGAAGLGNPFAATIDGRDNIYIHTSSNVINRVSPDGIASVFFSDPTVGFEYEGVNIAGDCADNLFVTPFVWPALGLNAGREEQLLVQIVGSTGKAAQILDGTKINLDLQDMDMIVYDRFSSNLLIWTDSALGRVYRVPLTCGAIDTDLHLITPAGQAVSGFSVPPAATLQRADGSTERVWSFKDVAASGRTVQFDTVLAGLHLGDHRAVASEAFLLFKNSFVAGEVKIPLNIPTVGVDGQIDLAVTTDKPSYGANQQVMSDLVLTNRDSSKRIGKLIADIVDEQGNSVAHLIRQMVSIEAGSSTALLSPFNTGATPPGRYTVRGSLIDPNSGLELVHGSVSFLISGADAGEAQVSARIAVEKAIYRPSEAVRLRDRVTNLTGSDTLTALSVLTRVTNPDGSVRFEKTEALPELAQGAVKDYQYSVALGFAPAGTYRATLSVLGISGAELAFSSVQFDVLSTETTGSGLDGTLLAVPKQIALGESAVFNVTAANRGNAALHALPLKVRIVDPVTQQIAAEFSYVAELEIGGTFQAATSWTASGRTGTTYVVALLATVGQNVLLLAQDTVTVTARPVNLDVDHSNPREARVLALVSCEQGAAPSHDDDGDEECDGRSKKEDASCAAARAQALRDYLTTLGVNHLVTTDAQEFQHQFRCGRYNTYWVSGGAYKLSQNFAKELREAVYHGDSLLLDGVHDERNALLDEAGGVKFRGHLAGKDFKVALGAGLFTPADIVSSGIALNYQSAGATVQAQFATPGKEPALLSNLYGNGRAFTAAFELTETIRRQPDVQAWRDVGAMILGYLASPPSSVLVEGAFLPVETTITNKGQAVDVEVRTALPAGAAVLSSEPAAAISSTEAVWQSNIGTAQTQAFELGVRLPFGTASVALPVTVNLVKGSNVELLANYPMQLEVRPLSQLFADVRIALAHLTPVPKAEHEKALHARKEVDDAQEALDQGNPDHAIEELIEAIDDLRSIKSVSTNAARLAIDRLLQEVALRWCDAQCNPPLPRLHDGSGFVPYNVYERFEARGGKSGSSDWEWALGYNTLAAGQSEQQNWDWVSGKSYKWALTYDGKGNGSYSVYDGSKLLVRRDYSGAAGILHAGNTLKFQVQSAEGLGTAKISVTATTLNGKALDVNLATAGNNKASSTAVYYFYPAMTKGFTVSGTVKLTFPGAVPQGSKLGFSITSGNASCK